MALLCIVVCSFGLDDSARKVEKKIGHDGEEESRDSNENRPD